MGAIAQTESCREQPIPRTSEPTYEIEVFFDGECPICIREIKMLRRMDRKKRIRFTDIAAKEFNPAVYGKDMGLLMDDCPAVIGSRELKYFAGCTQRLVWHHSYRSRDCR